MIDETSFVEEIRSQPLDITPRLIYADFLEEAGDPRGEFIRVQCQLSQSSPGDPMRAALFDRERALLDKYGDLWLAPVRELGVEGVSRTSFQGGLLERVRISTNQFLNTGAEICERSPALRSLQLHDLADFVSPLAGYSMPSQITELDLGADQLDAECLVTLAEAKWLSQIRSVDLRMNQLKDDGVIAFVSGAWAGLQSLHLGNNGIGAAGVQPLAVWPHLQNLKRLDLSMNPLTNLGLNFLTGASLPSLEFLNLSSCSLGSLASLVDADANFPSLRELIVRNNVIPPDSRNAVTLSPLGEKLTRFDTRNNPSR